MYTGTFGGSVQGGIKRVKGYPFIPPCCEGIKAHIRTYVRTLVHNLIKLSFSYNLFEH